MTRIISGRAGGIRLDVPARGTRPTSDRVRESLFAALDAADVIVDARAADLYAGSGALGLEALSRGARSVDLVEKASSAAAVLQGNARRVTAALDFGADSASVHRAAVAPFLATTNAGPWDLVFLDPPYDLSDADLDEVLIALRPALSDDATVVVERARRSPVPDWERLGYEPWRDRAYGDTRVCWAQPLPESQSR